MWLKKLTLKNFQKHEQLTLDLTPGVNYIYGHSDAGKSCVFRAIGFLFFGDPRADSIIRKEGSKQTSVCGLLDNGTEVERVKSSTINRYIVRVPNQKEQVYDSIGAEIPEEVKKVLQVNTVDIDKISLNLNMAKQISLPFLDEVPGSTRLKLFNKLTGNDLLDKVVQNINREILNLNKEIKNAQEIITTNQPQIEKITQDIKIKDAIRKEVIEKRSQCDEKIKIYKTLKELHNKIAINKQRLEDTKEQLKKIKILDETKITFIKEALTTLQKLDTLKMALQSYHNSEIKVKHDLSLIKIPEINLDDIKDKINQIEKLIPIKDRLIKTKGMIIQNQTGLKEIENKVTISSERYRELLKEAKICPTCKIAITDENLAHIHI